MESVNLPAIPAGEAGAAVAIAAAAAANPTPLAAPAAPAMAATPAFAAPAMAPPAAPLPAPTLTSQPEIRATPDFAPGAPALPLSRHQFLADYSTTAKDLQPPADAAPGSPAGTPPHQGDTVTPGSGLTPQGGLHRPEPPPAAPTPAPRAPSRQLTVGLRLDNDGSPDWGSEQLTLQGHYRHAAIPGDELAGHYGIALSEGLDTYSLSYQVPLSPLGGGLQLQVAGNSRRATAADLAQYDLQGAGQTYRLRYGQPVHQDAQTAWGLSLAARYQSDRVAASAPVPLPLAAAPDGLGTARVIAVELGQWYTAQDQGGQWDLQSLLVVGSGQFSGSQGSPTGPDGLFGYWRGQGERRLPLSDRHELVLAVAAQLSPQALLGPEQFTLGGMDSVRGYRRDSYRGDNGLRLSLCDRITLQRHPAGEPLLLLIPFLDGGVVWNAGGHRPPQLSDQALLGTGVGLLWQPLIGLTARLDWGLPLIGLPRTGQSLQDQGLYFQIGYQY